MSEQGRTNRNWMLFLAVWVVAPALLLGTLVVFILRGGSPGTTPTNGQVKSKDEENPLATARAVLAKQADLGTCRDVVMQLNLFLREAKEPLVPPLTSRESERLQKQLGVDGDSLAEVSSPAYTPLDAHHLEACFLLRDAARSLELSPLTGNGKTVRQSPLDRAEAGFAWVVRQIRLHPPDGPVDEETAPPVAVLKRGLGTPLERGLVFLALLEQFGLDDDETKTGLQGCLLFRPDEKGVARFWACGVTVGTAPDTLYLFDPRLGLPLPGPGGQGIATLAQARTDPAILSQLKIADIAYDVTPQQVRSATVGVVCPLSAMAPRMHFLQDRLLREREWDRRVLPAGVRVRLAEDPARALDTLRAAFQKSGGKGEDVSWWREGVLLLRRFLPKEDGGSDVGKPPRDKIFLFRAVPWEAFPVELRSERADLGPGLTLRETFGGHFVRPLVEANTPRDLILRGRFARAVPELVREQEQWQLARRRRQEAVDLKPKIEEWRRQAIGAYADLRGATGTPNESEAKARYAQVWKWRLGDPIEVLMNGAIAGPRGAEVMFQLALCRHEQAMRSQLRVDLARGADLPVGSDLDTATRTWTDAVGYWKEYLDNNARHPGVVAARRMRGEAQARSGHQAEAVKTWSEAKEPMTQLETLANRWRAKQVR